MDSQVTSAGGSVTMLAMSAFRSLVTGKDPDGRCAGSVGGTCDDAGQCACGNHKLDGHETDVDCGGSECKKRCDDGQTCGGGDCSSTHCYDTGGGTKVCCNQDCTGRCNTCALQISYTVQGTPHTTSWVGQCVPMPYGAQGKCSSGKACSAAQQCVTGKVDSDACGGNGECVSGFCETQYTHQFLPFARAAGGPCISGFWCSSNQCDATTNLCH